MKEVIVLLNKNANYIYHMLSIAKAGYDNEYGSKYAKYHDTSQIKLLNEYKQFITVKGGEHCGELYELLVAKPASLSDSIPVIKYYETLIILFSLSSYRENLDIDDSLSLLSSQSIEFENYEDFYNHYKSYSKIIYTISTVMKSNYKVYSESIWEQERRLLQLAASKINEIFSMKDYIGLWEKTTGYTYSQSKFYIVLCNSIENGPQAINISLDKDVFNIPTDYNYFTQFVSHEIGIFVLFNELKDYINKDFKKYWIYIESLLGFYNELVLGESILCWSGNFEYKEYYKELYYKDKNITAINMLEEAIKKSNI